MDNWNDSRRLEQLVRALEGVMILYGRDRIAPYPHEPIAWREARAALKAGKDHLRGLEDAASRPGPPDAHVPRPCPPGSPDR